MVKEMKWEEWEVREKLGGGGEGNKENITRVGLVRREGTSLALVMVRKLTKRLR